MNWLNWLRSKLRDLVNWAITPERPGPIYVFLERQTGMASLEYRIIFPPNSDPEEIITRELAVFENSTETGRSVFPAETVDKLLTFAQGVAVKLELSNIDNNDNKGPASTREFTALDTIAPGAPGEMGVELVREIP